MKKYLINIAKERLEKRQQLQNEIIEDLTDFCEKYKFNQLKIITHSNSDVAFYQIHFNNESNFLHSDVLMSELFKAGYSPKDWHGNLPESFYLIVLRVAPKKVSKLT